MTSLHQGGASKFFQGTTEISKDSSSIEKRPAKKPKIYFKSNFSPVCDSSKDDYLPKLSIQTPSTEIKEAPQFAGILSSSIPNTPEQRILLPDDDENEDASIDESDVLLTQPGVEKALAQQQERANLDQCNACGGMGCNCEEEQENLFTKAVIQVANITAEDERRLAAMKRKRNEEIRNNTLQQVNAALAPLRSDPALTPPRRRDLSQVHTIGSPESPGLLNLMNTEPTRRHRNQPPERSSLVTAVEPITTHDRYVSRDGHLLLTEDVGVRRTKIDLRPYFMMKSADAAKALGMSTSGLSKLFTKATNRESIRDLDGNVRRRRWPNRKLVGIDTEIRLLCYNNNINFTADQLSFCFRRPHALANISAASEELEEEVSQNAQKLQELRARPREQLTSQEASQLAEFGNAVKDAQLARSVQSMLVENNVPTEVVQKLHELISYRMIRLIGTKELYVEVRYQ